jgi:K+/H+ antiporter YhaU regulatory subunit KhtT
LESFQNIEIIHEKVHHILQTIYKLSFVEVEIDNKLYLKSSINKTDEKQQSTILAYCKDFNKATKSLSYAIKKLYIEVLAIPESRFQKDFLLTSK